MSEPLHVADKIVYTVIALYALAILVGMELQSWLPYEQAKRVEWWTDLIVSIPFAVAFYGAVALMFLAPCIMIYVIWFGADTR